MLERGLQLYYKLHQKDLPAGVTIQLIERDDTGLNPETAKRLAQELVTRDHVQHPHRLRVVAQFHVGGAGRDRGQGADDQHERRGAAGRAACRPSWCARPSR